MRLDEEALYNYFGYNMSVLYMLEIEITIFPTVQSFSVTVFHLTYHRATCLLLWTTDKERIA